MKKRVSQIILAKKPGDYAGLRDELGPHWLMLSIHGDVRIGLNSPGIPARPWVSTVSTLLCARAGLVAAWTTLANMIWFLLGAMNPGANEPHLWPDFALLLEVARRTGSTMWAAKAEYKKSLIEKLEAVVFAAGDLFRTFNGLDLPRDIIGQGRSAVIDISGLDPPWVRLFLIDLLFAQVFYHRTYHYRLVDRTEVVMVLDEADADIVRG